MGQNHTAILEPPYRKVLIFGGPVVAYALLIFYLSSLQNIGQEVQFFRGFDKCLHFGEYFFFGALILRWLSVLERIEKRRTVVVLTIMIGTGYAFSDEWHQSFVPGRDASGWDVLFDALGIAAGAALYGWLRLKLLDASRDEVGRTRG